MKINDDHLYHGAALTQIAEHPSFTAINVVTYEGAKSRCGFRVNDKVGVYIKYASAPAGAAQEYVFNFEGGHLKEMADLRTKCDRVFAVLVCIRDRTICAITYEELVGLVEQRKKLKKMAENQYQILVTTQKGKQCLVYVNRPGRKGLMLGSFKVARNAFPSVLFDTKD